MSLRRPRRAGAPLRAIAAALALVAAATPASAAPSGAPFPDVPTDHWARDLIRRAAEAGILEGYEGRFDGKRSLSRYELAAVVGRILQAVGEQGDDLKVLTPRDAENLQRLVAELGEDHIAVAEKVDRMDHSMERLEERLQAVEGRPARGGGPPSFLSRLEGGIGHALTGFVSVGLVDTDRGANGMGGGYTRYHLDGSPTLGQTFFTIPQASLTLHHEVAPGTLLHAQFDYTTDVANPVGGGVGLNEAYLRRDRLVGAVGGKVGGFAVPYQDWEFDGPFRTLTASLTPSIIGTFFERFRVLGMELTRLTEIDPRDTRWRLGIFTGGDLPVTPAGDALPPPTQDDSVGLGALTRTATFDGELGYYLDVESGDDPDRRFGWRLGAFDLGGDLDATTPRTPSQEFTGYVLGLWWRTPEERLRVTGFFGAAERDFVRGAFPPTDIRAGYLRAAWKAGAMSTVAARYDRFRFRDGTIVGPGQAGGHSWLLAWNRKLSATDLLQLEVLTQDQVFPARAVVFPGGLPDPADDLIQLRYKVWF